MDRVQKSELIGRPAGNFILKDIDGNTVTLADFIGKVIILDFWATWCAPCVKQMPEYVTLQKNYAARGATVIGISVDEKAETVRKFAKKHKLNFPLLMADHSRVKREYGGITAIPTTFVIDKKGVIRYRYVGAPPDKLAFQKHLEELLAEK
ncbi:MAG: peroxiredoxin family protein [bacterium]